MKLPFPNRVHAGRLLAERLDAYRDRPDVVVLALPRGGVPVGFEVAERLHAPLDVLLVRKLAPRSHPGLPVGAIASGGIRVLDESVIDVLGLDPEAVAEAARRELVEIERRERVYRGGRVRPELRGHRVILVDDGVATGTTLQAAARVLQEQGPRQVVVALPVAPDETVAALRGAADDVVFLATPPPFLGVGGWYEELEQTSDEGLRSLLDRAAARTAEEVALVTRGLAPQ